MGNSKRERGAKAMKLTLVNLIIATVMIINMVMARTTTTPWTSAPQKSKTTTPWTAAPRKSNTTTPLTSAPRKSKRSKRSEVMAGTTTTRKPLNANRGGCKTEGESCYPDMKGCCEGFYCSMTDNDNFYCKTQATTK